MHTRWCPGRARRHRTITSTLSSLTNNRIDTYGQWLESRNLSFPTEAKTTNDPLMKLGITSDIAKMQFLIPSTSD